jgi:fluoroquinolone transport system permease protein
MVRLAGTISLLCADLRSALRDPIMIMSLAAPLLLAAVLHYGLVWAAPILKEYLGFAVGEHRLFMISFFPIITPMALGSMAGLFLLEEREGGLLAYLSVTPLTRTGYLLVRLAVPTAFSFIFGLLLLPPLSPAALPLFPLALVLAISSLLAPITALFLGAFAANRVEGLALAKGVGIIMITPLGMYLLNYPWNLITGIFPPHWASAAFLGAAAGTGYAIPLAAGAAVHLIYLWGLWRIFERRAN